MSHATRPMTNHASAEAFATLEDAAKRVMKVVPQRSLRIGDWVIANPSMPFGGEVFQKSRDCDGVSILFRTLDDDGRIPVYVWETVHPRTRFAIDNNWRRRDD